MTQITAANRSTTVVLPDAEALPLPPVSVTPDAVYFLDGNSQLKRLSVSGVVSTVMQLPGDRQTQVGFSVSPDDRRIAISAIHYGPRPRVLQNGPVFQQVNHNVLTIQDLGSGHRVMVNNSLKSVEWPIGWHNNSLVIGRSTYVPGTQQSMVLSLLLAGPLLTGPARSLVVLDASGHSQRSICGFPNPVEALCGDSQGLYLFSWNGVDRPIPGTPPSPINTWPTVLSSDGQRFAYSSGSRYGTIGPVVTRNTITGTDSGTAFDGVPIGWIDPSHVVVASIPSLSSSPGPTSTYSILDVRRDTAIVLPFAAYYAELFGTIAAG